MTIYQGPIFDADNGSLNELQPFIFAPQRSRN